VEAVPQEARDFILLMAVGFVLLTLFVNAPTLRLMMKALRLDHLDPHERMVRNRVMALSRARVDEQVKRVAADLDVAWPPPSLETVSGAEAETGQLTPRDRLMVGLTAIANHETELSLDYLTRGVIDRDIAETMIAHAGRVLDGLKTAGIEGYDRAWQRNYGLTRRFRSTLWLQRRFGLSGPLAAEIASRFELLLIKERLLKDLLLYLEDSVAPVIGPDVAAELRALIVARDAANTYTVGR
jgi:CPA1 family monovalent cation:H+ antiporter